MFSSEIKIPENPLQTFPEGFTPRPAQKKTLLWLAEHLNDPKTKFFILNLPTGSGKSHIAATVARWSHEVPENVREDIFSYKVQQNKCSEKTLETFQKEKFGAFILTITKNLQDQYKNLFPDFAIGKGMSEYNCQLKGQTQVPVSMAICQHIAPGVKIKKCFPENICPYYKMKNEVLASQVSVLNYDFFLSFAPEFARTRQILICDEADVLEEAVVNKNTFEFSIGMLENLKLHVSKFFEPANLNWDQAQFEALYKHILEKLKKLTEKVKDENTSAILKKKLIRKIQQIEQITDNMKHILRFYYSAKYSITFDIEKEILVCIPREIEPFLKDLFQNADKVLFMSATILKPPLFAKFLGLPDGSWKNLELDSSFDAKKSPIYFDSQYSINFKNKKETIPLIVEKALHIAINCHPKEKGIIHTHTFEICNYFSLVLEEIRYQYGDSVANRFLIRTENDTNQEIIRKHFESPEPTILISPSLDIGISLDGDLGRFQIICKAPFAPWTNPHIEYMRKKFSFYYEWQMLSSFIQMCGRCTRNESDYSVTYCLDAVLKKRVKEMSQINFFPKYFLDRIC